MSVKNLRKILSAVTAVIFFVLQSNCLYAQVAPNETPTLVETPTNNMTATKDGSTLTVNTTGGNSIGNMTGNLGADATWITNQSSASSIALYRFVDGTATSIFGKMISNGRLFLVNPNGIIFGASSSVNANGLLASTLDISNEDFLAGKYNFKQNGKGGFIINQGNIHVANGGYVLLLSSAVSNMGTIEARLGRVVLAAGEKMTVALDDNSDVSVVIDDAVKNDVFGPDGQKMMDAIKNSGSIVADGGKVLLTAKVLKGIFNYAVNNTGVIQANSLVEHNGTIELTVAGGDIRLASGSVVSAKSTDNNTSGGSIIFKTDDNITVEENALIDASGAGYVEFDANGMSINSHSIYTSSPIIQTIDGITIDDTPIQSTGGGTIVFKPYDIRIQSGGASQSVQDNPDGTADEFSFDGSDWTIDPLVLASMHSSEIYLRATHDVFINSDINLSSALHIEAGHNINVNANVTTAGQDINFIADTAGTLGGRFTQAGGTVINSNGGNITAISGDDERIATINAGNGNVLVLSKAGSVLSDNSTVTGNTVNLYAANYIINANGSSAINTSANVLNANGLSINVSNNKSITLNNVYGTKNVNVTTTAGDISLNSVKSGFVELNSAGKIDRAAGSGVADVNIDAGSGNVELFAATGIGSNLAPNIKAGTVHTAYVSGAGDINFNIKNAGNGPVNLGSAATGGAIHANNGNITVHSDTGLLVNTVVAQDKTIDLTTTQGNIDIGNTQLEHFGIPNIDAGSNGEVNLSAQNGSIVGHINNRIRAHELNLDTTGDIGGVDDWTKAVNTDIDILNVSNAKSVMISNEKTLLADHITTAHSPLPLSSAASPKTQLAALNGDLLVNSIQSDSIWVYATGNIDKAPGSTSAINFDAGTGSVELFSEIGIGSNFAPTIRAGTVKNAFVYGTGDGTNDVKFNVTQDAANGPVRLGSAAMGGAIYTFGDITIKSDVGLIADTVLAQDHAISLTANNGDINVGTIDAGTNGSVNLSANNGAIIGNTGNLIMANRLSASALNGIGASNPLNTQISLLNNVFTINGAINIKNTGITDLTVNTANSLNGDVDIHQSGGGALNILTGNAGNLPNHTGNFNAAADNGNVSIGSVTAGNAINVTTTGSGDVSMGLFLGTILQGNPQARSVGITSAGKISGYVQADNISLTAAKGINANTSGWNIANNVIAHATTGDINILNTEAYGGIDSNVIMTTGTGNLVYNQNIGTAVTIDHTSADNGNVDANVNNMDMTADSITAAGTGHHINLTVNGGHLAIHGPLTADDILIKADLINNPRIQVPNLTDSPTVTILSTQNPVINNVLTAQEPVIIPNFDIVSPGTFLNSQNQFQGMYLYHPLVSNSADALDIQIDNV